MQQAHELSERLWRGTVGSLAEEKRMHGSRRAVVVKKTCKIRRTTRGQCFECYCREFETDAGVDWKPV